MTADSRTEAPSESAAGTLQTSAPAHCEARNAAGAPCGHPAVSGQRFCIHHGPPEIAHALRWAGGKIAGLTKQLEQARRVAPLLALAEVKAALGPLDTVEQVRRAQALVATWALAQKVVPAAASAAAKLFDGMIDAFAVEDDRRIITTLERRVKELERELTLERRRPRAVR